MGRKSSNRERKEITKRVNKWLAALLIRLQNEELEKLTIDDLAKLAGKSKSTIYEYFQSKEEIILAACQTRINLLAEQIGNTDSHPETPIELYEYFVGIFSQGIADISINFLQKIKDHYPTAWSAIDQFTNSFAEILKGLYQEGMKKGQFEDISVELLTHFDKYFMTQVVTNPNLFSDPTYTLSDLVEDYLKLRLEGLVKGNSTLY